LYNAVYALSSTVCANLFYTCGILKATIILDYLYRPTELLVIVNRRGQLFQNVLYHFTDKSLIPEKHWSVNGTFTSSGKRA
jgi:hypothetical protein